MKSLIALFTAFAMLCPHSRAEEGPKPQLPAARVSIFQVPMRCPAAPQIGCGSFAKPFLVELTKNPIVREAWLNRAGTLLAVVSAETFSREDRAKVVQAISRNSNLDAKELQGVEFESALANFNSPTGWYKGSEVDKLSGEEANLIAQRLIRRIKVKVFLSADKAAKLEPAIADVFKRQFMTDASKTNETSHSDCDQELVKVASVYLDEKTLAVFKEALKPGWRPIPEDKEPQSEGSCCTHP
ncbi:MAG: hypothetical protein H0X34_16815 [Chthoniobacterales bacterium]|nr:hypothetical protein [Chthoniobacterales bacterium]